MDNREQVEQEFQRLADNFRLKVPGILEKMKTGINVCFRATCAPPGVLEKIYYMAHKLNGTGKTFGMESVTLYSKKIENLLQSLIKSELVPTEEIRLQLLQWLDLAGGQAPGNKE